MAELPFDTLLEATWLAPPPGSSFEDRPPSPERIAAASSSSGGAGAGKGAGVAGGSPANKPAYR